jgi:hypothetical protein
VWELPLFTIWTTVTWVERAFAVVHCTGGDLLIALVSPIIALVSMWATGRSTNSERVAVAAVALAAVVKRRRRFVG